ncbi:2-(R)-hydroxypropyl-CoM dehydrogenase [Paraburkholderia hiiakae]|uniref:2-(R)-hydroxypropyl-CoM dehydrogenase n=1 Tax=Paraburkholderia hiiakae TaxID=1081782 RepID=A0ABN7I2S6_9BURK|nr:SDR family NAD(P)-dependent oxidoreductase [Paraburkholderia hiiakae]CAD6544973.1 2-(R)-hydroxypropyl-CoM dehydrogenase [Paraburkholderia hiiakae]
MKSTLPLLVGKIAFVTGAGQGNGRAIAIGLAEAGASVVVSDMNEANARETAATIEAHGHAAYACQLDVTDAAQCRAVAEDIAARLGAIDVLVNNAGILVREGIDSENALSNLQRVMKVNHEGTFNVCHACLPSLRKTRGAIVNVASIASFSGQPNTLGYSPSKGAVKMLTQSLAVDLARDGIRVNAIAPGVIETPMTVFTRDDPAKLERFMSRVPMKRVGKPEELVGAVLFLASPMSTYVTGVTLPVDGGYLAA